MDERDRLGASLFATVRFRIGGDRMLLADYGQGVDPAVNERVRRMAALVNGTGHPAIEAVVPAYCTLAIHYDPLATDPETLMHLLRDLEQHLESAAVPEPAVIDIPVCYGGAFGPDLEAVAAHNHLSSDEVIRLHSHGRYRVYAIGFSPGFCYLGGLDPRLATPRLTTPRLRVAAGSVGIGGDQTGGYPLASPGGWQLIGRTPLSLFVPQRDRPVLYQAGDSIRFRPISAEMFARLAAEARP